MEFQIIILTTFLIINCSGYILPALKPSQFLSSSQNIHRQSPLPSSSSSSLFGGRGSRGLSRNRTHSRPDPTDALYVYPSSPFCPTTINLLKTLDSTSLEYKLVEGVESRPKWLEELYEGETPAIRHGGEAYTGEGAVQYIEFFFKEGK